MRKQALEMYIAEGNFRHVARQLHVAPRTVSLWLAHKAGSLPNAATPFVKNEIVQASEPIPVPGKIQIPTQLAVAQPIAESRPLLSQAATLASAYSRFGWLPAIALLQSCGLLLLAWTFVTARAGTPWSETFFWTGLAILVVPVAIRLYSTVTPRHERIALILLLGGVLYLVKVMHSPYAFTFPDEFSAFRNVREVLENQRLFQENPELPVTALYPGLATVTSLLASLTGLSIYPTGLLVISAARFVLFLGLFLLYEWVSGSARIGSLATLFYMANTNFFFYTAEFSYESLALPMAVFVLYLVARRETTKDHRLALTVVALFGVFMVVISHHMTSYILTGLLFATCGISIVRTRGRQRGPWDLALITGLATAFWLVYVATYTITYLSPVLVNAVSSILHLAMQEETSRRQLFKSSATGYVVVPLWQQLTVWSYLLIIALGLPVGLWKIWRRYRDRMIFLLLGVVALAYIPMQGLRLTSAGWETANRSSEFLFIGVGLVAALAINQILRFKWLRPESKCIHPVIVTILFFGGFLAGWPPQARMPRPYLVDTGLHIVEPQNIQVAKWTLDHLGPDHRIATSRMNAKLLSAYGVQDPFTGWAYGIRAMLISEIVGPGEVEIIQKAGIEYVASDRREISWDHIIGMYFFNQKTTPSYELLELESYEKFDGLQGVNRILDSGDIVFYDVRVYLETPLEVIETLSPSTGSMPAVEAQINPPDATNRADSTEVEIEGKENISTNGEKGLPFLAGPQVTTGTHITVRSK
jgi:hypothetical protein